LRREVRTSSALLAEIRDVVASRARPDMSTSIDGLFLSRVETSEVHHSLTEPLLVVMAQGGKQLLLGEHVLEYRTGQCLVVTTELAVSGHFIGATPRTPALGVGLALRPAAIAPLLLETAAHRRLPTGPPAIATGTADLELLDAVARMLRLLDRPADARVLAPMVEREILWRLLTGPHGAVVRQIGLADSSVSQIGRVIGWIRANYAEPVRVADMARMAGMSPAAFHRHFRAVTATSPVQFQKRVRLQEARALLVARPDDIAGVGHLVGYDSPSQFNREYRRLFGEPPGRDATRLRAAASAAPVAQLP
jgi:AraC-like DNA-binding protein